MTAAVLLAPLFACLPACDRAPLVAPTPPTADDARAAWFTDPAAAAADAARRGVPLVIVLTATDWCGPCMELESEVFHRGPFARAAGEFALLALDTAGEADRPAARANYEAFAERYGTRMVPTVVVADAAGRPLGLTGNPGGGLSPGRYRAHLKALAARRAVRDAAFARAESLAGPARAAALHAGLAAVWEEDGDDHAAALLAEYQPEVAALLAADPAGETGPAALWRGRAEAQSAADRTAALRQRLRAAYDADGIDAALAVRDELVAEGLTPAERSAVSQSVTVFLSWSDRHDEAAAQVAARLRGFDSAFAPPTDEDRWSLRERLAYYTGRAGRADEGDRLYREVVGDLLAAGDRDLAYKFARRWQQGMMFAGRYDEALATLDDDPLRTPPASADPGDRAFLQYLVHRRAGRPAEAAAAILRITPELEDAGNRLAWLLRAAEAWLEAGDRPAAATALAAAAAVPEPRDDAVAADAWRTARSRLPAVRRAVAGPLTAPRPPTPKPPAAAASTI